MNNQMNRNERRAARKAHGLVRVERKRSIKIAPLCDACLAGDKDRQIMRKFLNAPDFEIGDRVTSEQLTALADKQAMTEH